MATKKVTDSKAAPQKTTVIKIAEKVGEIAGKIANKKDQLVSLAGDALASVTGAVANVTSAKKTVKLKPAVAKPATSKTLKPTAKKPAISPVRKTTPKPAVAAKKSVAPVKATKVSASKKNVPVPVTKKVAAKKPSASTPTAPRTRTTVAKPAAAKTKSKK